MQAIPSENGSTLAASMEQTSLTPAKCFVRDLVAGQEVDDVFLVRDHSLRQRRSGEPFVKLRLGDVTGAVEGVVWDSVDQLAPLCAAGTVVRVSGRYTVDERYGGAITVRVLRAAVDGEYLLADLLEGPPVPYEQLAADLEALVETVQRPHLRELLRRLIDRLHRCGPGLARGAGGQVLPPGLPPRPARALSVRGSGRERPGRHLPRHRP